MTRIKLFGKEIEVEEKPKTIKLFGTRIYPCNVKHEQEQEQEAALQENLPPTNMCQAIRLAGGSRLVYIGRKKAEDSDINPDLSRLLIPGTFDKELLKNLSEEERIKLENDDKNKSFEVKVMDQDGNFHKMKFTRWQSLKRFVLNKGWNNLVEANNLQKGDTVDLWHFRIDLKLCFAINIIKN
ncbi:putative B3 domain-containing protein At3g49610 [Nicotiana tabacum]|uniref:B3 domain-containing protein At3g49610 n=2 Tax=Nicotiana TaxID=4085 RepID=A0A1S4C414_TOBAC|nr:PREDICTED: putative B3 domain-containing protein At3g49610 [Nicotiana sylvestris]XP_016495804.1 PREDICTED: putative B3 domain-containing protein At3g49610 [Nicotiana tabacum]